MPASPVAFIKPSTPWRDTRHVEHFGAKTEGDILPPREVESGGPVLVQIGLGGDEALVVQHAESRWMRSGAPVAMSHQDHRYRYISGGRASERE